MKRIIDIQELHFHYKRQTQLITDFSLQLRTGKIHGLFGKKGEGKTTLLKLISGLLFPLSGQINVLGFQPGGRKTKMLEEIFFLPEDIQNSSLGIEEFESIYAPFYPNFSSTSFYIYLNDFILDPRTDNLSEMSYAQRKKFFIAFGLATNAKLILLDEPTEGLDVSSKEQFVRLLSSFINEKCCILISSQQYNDFEDLLGKIIIMNEHEIVFNETSEDVTKKLFFSTDVKIESEKPIIYSTTGLEGYNLLCENPKGESSKLNVELLYNAVLADQVKICNIFTK
jgi:ABC-2 type transport system ATP-binding protein